MELLILILKFGVLYKNFNLLEFDMFIYCMLG